MVVNAFVKKCVAINKIPIDLKVKIKGKKKKYERKIKWRHVPFDVDPWRRLQTLHAQSNLSCCIHNRPHARYCYFDGNPCCTCHNKALPRAVPIRFTQRVLLFFLNFFYFTLVCRFTLLFFFCDCTLCFIKYY